jgi:hypothetical protein
MKSTIFNRFILFIALFGGVSSCTEEIDIELENSYARLIVFGEISTDTTKHTIRLTRSADYFYNKPAEGVSGAIVRIYDGVSEIQLIESELEPGSYQTESDYYGVPDRLYSLTIHNVDINKDGAVETYSAISYLPIMAAPDSIQLNYARYPFFQGHEILLFARDPSETEDFYAFKVLKNGIQQTDSLPEILVQNDQLFNGNYTCGVSVQYLDDDKPGEKVFPGDTIVFEMYGITAGYYNFIIQAQTALFGSNPLFSGPPANVTTNLTNGAIGYFAGVNVKRAGIVVL